MSLKKYSKVSHNEPVFCIELTSMVSRSSWTSCSFSNKISWSTSLCMRAGYICACGCASFVFHCGSCNLWSCPGCPRIRVTPPLGSWNLLAAGCCLLGPLGLPLERLALGCFLCWLRWLDPRDRFPMPLCFAASSFVSRPRRTRSITPGRARTICPISSLLNR